MVSLAIWCQFLCIVAVSSCPCLRKELQWGECGFLPVVFVGVTGDCGYGSRLFLFLMRCSGYA